MTTIESIKKRLENVIVGSCVFNKQDIAEAIKNFYVVFCNEVILTEYYIKVLDCFGNVLFVEYARSNNNGF